MCTIYRKAFAPARKLYRIRLLFHTYGRWFLRHFCNEVRSHRADWSLKWRVTYRIGVHIKIAQEERVNPCFKKILPRPNENRTLQCTKLKLKMSQCYTSIFLWKLYGFYSTIQWVGKRKSGQMFVCRWFCLSVTVCGAWRKNNDSHAISLRRNG